MHTHSPKFLTSMSYVHQYLIRLEKHLQMPLTVIGF